MNFKEKLKKIRKEENLTQEEFANILNVTRQAISNWENNKNLPDIEMLIDISKKFDVSLDDLLKNEQVEKKIINDSKELKCNNKNISIMIAGFINVLIGVIGILIKSLSVEYVSSSGLLKENFFLLPASFLFITIGFIIFIFLIIKNIKKNNIFLRVSIIFFIIMIILLSLLIKANS